MNLLLPVLVFFPMAGAVASYLCGRRDKRLRDMLCCALTAVEFALSAALLLGLCSTPLVHYFQAVAGGLL